jgi:uncharacterized protein YcbK (DUF882 family)
LERLLLILYLTHLQVWKFIFFKEGLIVMQDKGHDAPCTPGITRRQILKVGLFASVACLSPMPAWARFSLTGLKERSLSLLNTHTGERLKEVVYWEKGLYLPDALHDINYVLRDHRTDEIHKIDPKTLDLMAAISRKLDAKRPFEIISGYRSPETNKYLRSISNGVAKNSYHIQGKAVDMRKKKISPGEKVSAECFQGSLGKHEPRYGQDHARVPGETSARAQGQSLGDGRHGDRRAANPRCDRQISF